MPLSQSIREIFVPLDEYPNIRDDATLQDAFAVLYQGFTGGKRFRHVLVLNEKRQLVGTLGLRDILRGLFPDYLRSGELSHHAECLVPDFPALTLIWAETFQAQAETAVQRPIKDLVAPITARVGLDDPVTKAAYLMVIHDTSMLPVVDGDTLVGVVRIIDVFNLAGEAVRHG